MVHITNGDGAARVIRESRIAGDVVPWRDVLHEGPVPEGRSLDELRGVRARFIAAAGWGALDAVLADLGERDGALARSVAHDEVVLWFEHDLYDQLQLLQVLDWFAGQEGVACRLSLVCGAEYLGSATPRRLRERFPQRQRVSAAQLGLARAAWAAFRAPDPTGLTRLLARDTSALPFLHGALRRHLQQFPSVSGGLSRSEAQILVVLARGVTRPRDIYVASHHDVEESIFLGDVVFAWYLEELGRGRDPLVVGVDGEPVRAPRAADAARGFWERDVTVTDVGRSVLDGAADRVRISGIDRWLGGIHLRTRGAPGAPQARQRSGRHGFAVAPRDPSVRSHALSGADACWRWDDAAGRLTRG